MIPFREISFGETVYIIHKDGTFTRIIKLTDHKRGCILEGNNKNARPGKLIKIKKDRATYYAIGGYGS